MKPAFCPFCKCDDYRVSVRRQGESGYRVICGRCGASGPYVKIGDRPKLEAQAEAVERWNSRWETSGGGQGSWGIDERERQLETDGGSA